MSRDALALLRSFYDLFDRRDLDALLAYFRPEAVFRDHRRMPSWGGAPSDWAAMVEGWWSMLPHGHVAKLDVLRADRDRNAHVVTVAGTDSITGGPAEFEFFVVCELAGRLVTAVDFFDDEASAIEYYDRLA